jgi:hypothetical protein
MLLGNAAWRYIEPGFMTFEDLLAASESGLYSELIGTSVGGSLESQYLTGGVSPEPVRCRTGYVVVCVGRGADVSRKDAPLSKGDVTMWREYAVDRDFVRFWRGSYSGATIAGIDER